MFNFRCTLLICKVCLLVYWCIKQEPKAVIGKLALILKVTETQRNIKVMVEGIHFLF